MFKIINKTITITKGDSAVFEVEIRDPNTKELYQLQPGDKVVLTVKPDKKDAEYLFQIDGPVFHILPEHTNNAKSNMRYYYDIELRFANGFDVNTVVDKTPFIIREGVNND